MDLRCWQDMETGDKHLHLVLTQYDLIDARLDKFDRWIINSQKEPGHWISDTLIDAQIIAHRLEQEEIRKREVPS